MVDAIVRHTQLRRPSLDNQKALDPQIDLLREYLDKHYPEQRPELSMLDPDQEHNCLRFSLKLEQRGHRRETIVDHAFLTSADFNELVALNDAMNALGPAPYTCDFDGDHKVAADPREVLKAVEEQGGKGQTIQRYKGLGEMNPEQLWETTMNPGKRTLLQVRVDDVVEADEVFTILMGDEVDPRRQFIEKNALDVQNLDI